MAIFKLEDVKYSYEKTTKNVLNGLTYEFEKGKIYAIIGKSGSGKTTLLSLMSGLDKTTSGRILYNDKDIAKLNGDEYRSTHVGVVFQSYNLLPHLTALENVILSMDITSKKIDNKREKALKILNDVGISEEKANRRILLLSGGEQQRVAIARALSYEPDVILADEPTGNLDPHNENQIIDIFTKLAHKEGKCVILVTHSKEVASKVDEVYDLEINNK